MSARERERIAKRQRASTTGAAAADSKRVSLGWVQGSRSKSCSRRRAWRGRGAARQAAAAPDERERLGKSSRRLASAKEPEGGCGFV